MSRLSVVVLVCLAVVSTACSSDANSSEAAPTTILSSTTESPATSSTTTVTTQLPTTTAAPDPIGRPVAATLAVDACGSESAVRIGLQTGVLGSSGVEYRYQWTIPSTYDGEAVPVVLDFHGLGSNGAQQGLFSGFAALAEAEGFVAVQPTGTSVDGDERASWELPQFETDERNDIAFVLDLLDLLAGEVCVDQNRIYATGMSNGGFFTSTLVCSLSERIAAAVSVAGTTHDESCSPSRPVPYLAFHGTDDLTVPYLGGGESNLAPGVSSEFFEQVMPDEFAEFASSFGCVDSSDTLVTAEVSLRSWSGCDGDIELGFYTIENAGHTWPGSPISAAVPALGETNLDLDATAIAWEFFERHSLVGADS